MKVNNCNHRPTSKHDFEGSNNAQFRNFNFLNTIPQNESSHINKEMEDVPLQGFDKSQQEKSKSHLDKINLSDSTNYDPCNMVDDEPDSDDVIPSANDKTFQKSHKRSNKNLDKHSVLISREGNDLKHSSFFSKSNYVLQETCNF